MDVTFDRADVEAAGDGKPWTHQEEFASEVDTEHMADTASIFARAANEARSAADLSRRATELGKQAGARNGESFVEDGRIDITSRGLQDDGEGIDEVVRMLERAMNRAMQAREEVDAQIFGGEGTDGMQRILEMRVQAAVRAWSEAQQFFASQPVPQQPGLVTVWPGVLEKPRFVFNNAEYEGVLSGGAWTAPPDLPVDIRDCYLNMTADDAAWADEEITGAIRQYRQALAAYGAELEEAGFDTSDGPLGIWRSPEMAAFNGEEFSKLLRQHDPDPDLLARYSAGLDSIAEDGQGRNGAKPPTAEQQAYLDAFFGKLTTEDLVAAGRLRGPEFEQAQQALANGIVAASAGREPLSQIREFLTEKPITSRIQDITGIVPAAERFRDFGRLMSQATLTPSQDFGTALINASLTAHDDYAKQSFRLLDPPAIDSWQLLSLGAKNDAAAAAFLSDNNNLAELFAKPWADNGGAVGDLIRSGTLPADGTFTENEAYKRTAGDTLTRFLSDNSDAILRGQWDVPARAERALADVVGHPEYLGSMKADDLGYPPRTYRDAINVLMSGEPETAAALKSHVDDYIELEARRILTGQAGQPYQEIKLLGELSGSVSNGALDVLHRMEKQNDEMAQSTYNVFKGILGVVGQAPGPYQQVAGVTNAAMDAAGAPEPNAERNDDLRRYWESTRGGVEELNRLYDAARDTNYHGMNDRAVARKIPYTHESWDLTDEQWKDIGSDKGPSRRDVLRHHLGQLGGWFLEGRDQAIGWAARRNDFDEDEAQQLLDAWQKAQGGSR